MKLKELTRQEILKGVIGLFFAIVLLIIGNKIILKTSSESSVEIKELDNSGNLSIGQKGGSLTQTTIINESPKIPNPRHLTSELILKLQAIPKTNKIELIFPSTSAKKTYKGAYTESIDFAEEILMFLINNGYSNINKIQVGMLVVDCDNFFCIKTNNTESKIFILMQEVILESNKK